LLGFLNMFLRKTFSKLSSTKSVTIIIVAIFLVYILSSFDVCWVDVPGKGTDKGFVFSPGWTEHLHSSEGWAVYYQIQAFSKGRAWLSESSPPPFSTDVFNIGTHYYAYAEPLTAAFLLPFYSIGQLILGEGYLIRSVLIGMIFYTCLAALVVRKISFQINQNQKIADLTALLFAFTTMAFSYSRLLYPQSIVCLLMLLTIFFLFRYKKSQNQNDLLCSALFYGVTVFSFNAFLITAPFFIYFIYRIGVSVNRKALLNLGLGLLPGTLLFVVWNYAVTGNPLMTLRQYIYPSITFQVLYPTSNGVWLNLEGVFGQLFSPVGILFVSPILFASIFGFFVLKSKAKEESVFLALLVVVFWLFVSFAAAPGNVTMRDFWIGGWASIARYMYLPSAILVIFVSGIFETVHRNRRVLSAWLLSLAIIISFLANMSFGVHRDFMIGLSTQLGSNSLSIWPYQQTPVELAIFATAILLISLVYPLFLMSKGKGFLDYVHNGFEKAIHARR
jgi:hypothetical protein